METKRGTRDDHLFVASRGCTFFWGFLLVSHLTFSAATSLSMRASWPIAHANFYPSPHDLWIPSLHLFAFYCFTIFGRLLFGVGLFTFNSMRCLASADVITWERSFFVRPTRVVNAGYGHNESTKLVVVRRGNSADTPEEFGVRIFLFDFYSFASILSDFLFCFFSVRFSWSCA